MSDKSDKSPLWDGLGTFFAIMAVGLSIGSCVHLADLDQNAVRIEQEKTKQLEIQLKIAETTIKEIKE